MKISNKTKPYLFILIWVSYRSLFGKYYVSLFIGLLGFLKHLNLTNRQYIYLLPFFDAFLNIISCLILIVCRPLLKFQNFPIRRLRLIKFSSYSESGVEWYQPWLWLFSAYVIAAIYVFVLDLSIMLFFGSDWIIVLYIILYLPARIVLAILPASILYAMAFFSLLWEIKKDRAFVIGIVFCYSLLTSYGHSFLSSQPLPYYISKILSLILYFCISSLFSIILYLRYRRALRGR